MTETIARVHGCHDCPFQSTHHNEDGDYGDNCNAPGGEDIDADPSALTPLDCPLLSGPVVVRLESVDG